MSNATKDTGKLLGLTRRSASLLWREPRRTFLLLRMANSLVTLSVLLKFFSLPRALEKISPPLRVKQAKGNDPQDLASAVDALLAADIFIFKPICWKRVAILHRYLSLNGIESQIKFGVRKEPDGSVSGHAWLEQNGQPFLEDSSPDYTVTYSFPSNEPQPPAFSFPLET